MGRELVDYAIDIFTKCDVREIKLEVRIENKGARKFYKKIGFEEKKVLKNYYEDGEDAVIMRKEVKET